MSLIDKLRKNIWHQTLKTYEEVLVKLASTEDIQNLLDSGCGAGETTLKIAQQIGVKKDQVFGIENYAPKIKAAEELGLKVSNDDLNQKISFNDNQFDLVTANFVIEHLFDVDCFISEICRVLKKGKCAIIGTENLSSWHNILALLCGYQPFSSSIALSSKYVLGNKFQSNRFQAMKDDESPHLRVFSFQGLKDIFEVYKFKVEAVAGIGYLPFWGACANMLSHLDRRHALFLLIKVRKV